MWSKSIDSVSYRSNLNTFVTNCKKLQYKQSMNEVADETVLLDWSDGELEELSKSTVRYSGFESSHEPVSINESEFSLTRKIPLFSDSFVNEYSRKEMFCSTSWATSVIEVAEKAVNYQFEFAVEQLMQCLPAYFEMDNGCDGVSPSDLMKYLAEVGLVRKDDFNGCENLNNQPLFKFEAITPEVPNRSGLMNFVAEGKPVFVMLALDLKKLRFVKDNRDYEPLRSGAMQPTMYGIVSGYNANAESPYWEIVSHILPAEEMIVRIPMTANDTNANYAGIAGYAFTLDCFEYPDIPTEAPPTEFYYSPSSLSLRKDIETSQTPTINGGTCSFIIISGSLPAGLTLNTNTGVISGTPTESVFTAVTVVIQATNTGGFMTTSLSFTVLEEATISFDPASYVISKGVSWSVTPMITGELVLLSITGGSLPSGLTLNTSTGVISGIPTESVSSREITIQIENDVSSDTAVITLTVMQPITSFSYPQSAYEFEVDSPVSITPMIDGDEVSYSIVSGTLPNGLVINSSSGVISGTCSGADSVEIVVEAINAVTSTPVSFGLSITFVTPNTGSLVVSSASRRLAVLFYPLGTENIASCTQAAARRIRVRFYVILLPATSIAMQAQRNEMKVPCTYALTKKWLRQRTSRRWGFARAA